MSNQLQITGGAKVRNLNGVITATTGVLSSVPLGAANGVATLDSGGKVPVSQLPASVVTYLGTWNAATNTPTLTNGVGDPGDLYICNVAGTANFGAGPITFAVGDWVLYGSGTWQKSNGQNGTVTSVAASINGSAIGITGSPITTAGTLTFAFAGTSAQYVAGDGSLVTFPSLTGYVPYTGATQTLDMGAYDVNARGFKVNGTAGSGHVDFKHQSGIPTGSASSSTLFADTNGDFAWKNDHNYITTLNSHANTADRVYTLPDASGTIALTSDIPTLSATAPISYSGGVISISQANTSTNGYLSSTDWNTFNGKLSASGTIPNGTILKYQTSTGTLVASDITNGTSGLIAFNGTILATSIVRSGGTSSQYLMADGSVSTGPSLSGYVPYTGATTEVDLGAYNLSSKFLYANGSGSASGVLSLKFGTSISTPSGYGTIGAGTAQQFLFASVLTGSYNKIAYLDLSYLSNSTPRTYTLQDASGTIALTSNLSSYLPLSGGTLTGALNGTTASFNSQLLLDRANSTSATPLRFTTAGTNNWFIGMSPLGTSTNDLSFYSYGNSASVFTLNNSTGAATFSRNDAANVSVTIANAYLNQGNLINFQQNKAGSTINAYIGHGGDSTGNFIINNGTQALTITNGGNVGIGTSSPSNPLVIANSSLGLEFNLGSYIANTVSLLSFDRNTSAYKNFNVITNSSNSSLFINTSGNVGIGVSSPASTLDVRAAIGAGQLIQLANTSGYSNSNTLEIGFALANSNSGLANAASIGVTNPSATGNNYGDIYFKTAQASGTLNERMRLTSDGNALFGTTTTSWTNNVGTFIFYQSALNVTRNGAEASNLNRLNSDGNVLNFHRDGSQKGNVSVTTTATFYNSISDYRLKSDFKDYNALLILDRIKTYDFKWDIDSSRMYGVIAHELQEILPYAVNGEKDGEEMQSVDYSKIVPVLIKAIQEQQQQIEELKAKIK